MITTRRGVSAVFASRLSASYVGGTCLSPRVECVVGWGAKIALFKCLQ
jgi:hypothetical protein